MRTEELRVAAGDGTSATRDRRSTLTVLWVFVTLNYIYCDVLGLHEASYLKQVLTGTVGGIEMSRGFLLGASILMEIPMGMVLLSWVLRPAVGRVACMIAGIVMTLVQVASLFMGDAPTPSYLFFSAIEIATTAFIVWYAWSWRVDDARRRA